MPLQDNFLRFDLFAALLLIGVAQGFFMTLLFMLKRPHRQPYHHLLLAALVFTFACVTLEIFLCYSGLMFRSLALVDFSEPANFAIGPVTYLLVRSLSGKNWTPKLWLHLVPFIFYLLYHQLFMVQPPDVKYNAYIDAYFPKLPLLAVTYPIHPDPLYLTRWINELTLLHISGYIVASFYFVYRLRKVQAVNAYFYSWTKLLLFFYTATLLIFLFVKLAFENDLGDHFLAVFISMQLFFISYKMLTGSEFFQPVVQVKYEKSALTADAKQELLQKLKTAEQSKFYLQPSASLPALAKQLNTTPHYLSQVINERLGKSFFEYLGQLRINEAKAILADPTRNYLKVEEIAEMTGYLSKSAFTAAFKKHTGTTPGEYRKTVVL